MAQRSLFEALASPQVSGAVGGGGFSTAGAVREQAPGATIGEGVGALFKNLMAGREQALARSDQEKAQAEAEQQKADTIKARIDFLVSKNVSPDRAAVFAQDPVTFGQVVDELNTPAAKNTVMSDGNGGFVSVSPDGKDIQKIYQGQVKPITIGDKAYVPKADGSGYEQVIDNTKPQEQDQIISHYNDAVKNGTFTGTLDEYAKLGKSGGTSVTVGGGPKLTETQSKLVDYYGRGKQSNDDLAPLENKLTELGPHTAADLPLVGNYMKTPEYRQAERAGREFLAIVLRKDSGAAITDGEMTQYGGIYLPEPGDDAQTIADKSRARARVLAGIKRGLGDASGETDKIDADIAAAKAAANAPATSSTPGATPAPKRNPVYNPATGNFE